MHGKIFIQHGGMHMWDLADYKYYLMLIEALY